MSGPLPSTTPLALLAFSTTLFTLSCYQCGFCGITLENGVLGNALFFGGLGQILSGIGAAINNQMLEMTVFISFGCFWLSFCTWYIPFFNVQQAYLVADPTGQQFRNAFGIHMIGWGITVLIFWIALYRVSVVQHIRYVLITVLVTLLIYGNIANSNLVHKCAGVCGICLSLLSYYMALSILLRNISEPLFSLPLGDLGKSIREQERHARAQKRMYHMERPQMSGTIID